MTFLESVQQAKALLERTCRVSFGGLARKLELDDDALAALVEELVDVQELAG